jgi:TolA-binding protein
LKTSRITIAIIALCLAGPAAAEDRAAAEQFFRLGAEAYKQGKFDVAATNFDSAYGHLKAPEIAFSAAQAHRLQYQRAADPAHLKRAVELYRAYVEGAPDGAKRRDALVYLGRLDDALEQIDPAQLAPARQKPSIYVSISLS